LSWSSTYTLVSLIFISFSFITFAVLTAFAS
jgi:hypothetical protein